MLSPVASNRAMMSQGNDVMLLSCVDTGVIAVVIFIILSALAVMGRCLYRRKETFQTQQPKGTKGPVEDSPEFPFNNDANTQYVLNESHREHFI